MFIYNLPNNQQTFNAASLHWRKRPEQITKQEIANLIALAEKYNKAHSYTSRMNGFGCTRFKSLYKNLVVGKKMLGFVFSNLFKDSKNKIQVAKVNKSNDGEILTISWLDEENKSIKRYRLCEDGSVLSPYKEMKKQPPFDSGIIPTLDKALDKLNYIIDNYSHLKKISTADKISFIEAAEKMKEGKINLKADIDCLLDTFNIFSANLHKDTSIAHSLKQDFLGGESISSKSYTFKNVGKNGETYSFTPAHSKADGRKAVVKIDDKNNTHIYILYDNGEVKTLIRYSEKWLSLRPDNLKYATQPEQEEIKNAFEVLQKGFSDFNTFINKQKSSIKTEKYTQDLTVYMKKYAETHKEEIADRHKKYYETNKETLKAYMRAYYEANKEKLKAQMRALREARKEINSPEKAQKAEQRATAKMAKETKKRQKAEQKEAVKMAKETEKRQKAEQKEAVKIAKETEKKQHVEQKETAKKAKEAEKRQKAEQKETAKIAKEAEKRQKAEQKETAKIAKEAEKKQHAEQKEAERKQKMIIKASEILMKDFSNMSCLALAQELRGIFSTPTEKRSSLLIHEKLPSGRIFGGRFTFITRDGAKITVSQKISKQPMDYKYYSINVNKGDLDYTVNMDYENGRFINSTKEGKIIINNQYDVSFVPKNIMSERVTDIINLPRYMRELCTFDDTHKRQTIAFSLKKNNIPSVIEQKEAEIAKTLRDLDSESAQLL